MSFDVQTIDSILIQPPNVTTSRYITEKYGDKQQLLSLLQKWNLEELFDYFMGKTQLIGFKPNIYLFNNVLHLFHRTTTLRL